MYLKVAISRPLYICIYVEKLDLFLKYHIESEQINNIESPYSSTEKVGLRKRLMVLIMVSNNL